MPHTRTLRRIPPLAALIVLAVLLGLAVSRGTAQRRPRHAEPQPHMQEALDALRTAEHHLREATGDKGGHRLRAIQLVNQAEAEVQRGIQWDNTHH
jgi:signal transduction histidine kinase